jgi:hypothetical protein
MIASAGRGLNHAEQKCEREGGPKAERSGKQTVVIGHTDSDRNNPHVKAEAQDDKRQEESEEEGQFHAGRRSCSVSESMSWQSWRM